MTWSAQIFKRYVRVSIKMLANSFYSALTISNTRLHQRNQWPSRGSVPSDIAVLTSQIMIFVVWWSRAYYSLRFCQGLGHRSKARFCVKLEKSAVNILSILRQDYGWETIKSKHVSSGPVALKSGRTYLKENKQFGRPVTLVTCGYVVYLLLHSEAFEKNSVSITHSPYLPDFITTHSFISSWIWKSSSKVPPPFETDVGKTTSMPDSRNFENNALWCKVIISKNTMLKCT